MRRSRFTEEQIIGTLREHEAGTSARELCRRLGVSQETLYRWKRKYGGLEVSDARRLRTLEEENGRLKRLVAEQALDVLALKDVLAQKLRAASAAMKRPSGSGCGSWRVSGGASATGGCTCCSVGRAGP